jgi:hypothetical protein
MKVDNKLKPSDLTVAIEKVLTLAARKAKSIDKSWEPSKGTPVFTVKGQYTSMGWTEWTQGFMFGNLLLAGDGLDDTKLMKLGIDRTLQYMLPHVTHIGVHDHGFNNLSTYGNIIRLIREKKIKDTAGIEETCKTAVAASGAVQASRWSGVRQDFKDKHSANTRALGYIYSFNGPHSLFIDTMRTTRILGVAWQLGHVLMHENDRAANLLKRSVLHGLTTSQYIVYHGDTQKTYDIAGRTAHEGTFNRNDGCFRARSTQQGYSPFSTWTRGLAWAMLGYAEELEFFKTISPAKFKEATGLNKADVLKVYENCAKQTCDHYINDCSALDGVTYWDDGAPNLHKLGDWQNANADPCNDHEPVDASASAIAAQGLIRLGQYLGATKGKKYLQAGLTVAKTLFDTPYLSTNAKHQGLLLHSIYHWPNHWDYVPAGSKVANGEASMWGDYHQLELAILIQRLGNKGKYPTFYL